MGSLRDGRGRWVAIFTVVLLVVSVVPVAAAEPEPSPSAISEQEVPQLPDAEGVQAGIEMAEAEEAAARNALESPAAVREREESRIAFAAMSGSEAKELLLSIFADEFAKLNSDPARFLGDAEILRSAAPTVATVSEEGDTSLLDAGMPVKAEDESGDLRKIDLSLVPTPGGFEAANPLTDVSIPSVATGKIEVGNAGLAVEQVGARPQAGLHLGDENIFYPDALGATVDTDMLVAPISTGVEIYHQLRSPESPETLRLKLDLPEGAHLRSDGNGGAEIVRDGERLALIPFPHAVDAQGTEVPVQLTVEGTGISLEIRHRDADLAYPILLDPAITEDWYNYNWFNGHNHQALTNGSWQYSESHAWIESSTSCIYGCWGGGRGLFVSMPNGAHWGSQYGHWSYSAPNTGSYLVNAWANPFVRNDHGCSRSTYPEPHDYAGMWHNGQWNRFLNDQAATYGYTDIQSWGSAFIVGLATGNGSAAPCWRDMALGGAAIWLDDWGYPSISPTFTGVPTTWINGTQQITIGASSSDAGLGVRLVTVTHEGKGVIGLDNVGGCTGLHASRCPNSRSSSFNMTGFSFGEGIRSSSVSAEDPTGKPTNGGSFQTKVDYSEPDVTLSSQLAEATDDDEGANKGDEKIEKLRLPVYNLEIAATDGSNTSNLHRRSGVKNIEIYLDGVKQTVPWTAQTATEDSRSMTKNYQVKLSTLTTSGLHKVEVKTVDQVNNMRVRSLEFEYFPATGMKDEYVMHRFKLDDGQDEAEGDYPRPELAVNVMNGNLVYHEQDLEVEGPTLDLEVERYYNSMLPENEDTEWGDGWTLAQTPRLEPTKTDNSAVYNRTDVRDSSGLLEGQVGLPTEVGSSKFDPELRATLTKKATGGYVLSDETEQTATSMSFDETGQAEALLTEGQAKLDFTYEAGKLSEIEVEDPATFDADPSELEIPKPQLITQPTYSSSFGVNGSGDGQLKLPGDIAIDSKGNLWVIDKGNNRIQKFDSSGKFLAKFGGTGAGNGQFNRPTGIAIASNGDLLVVDAGNARVQRFSSAGVFLSKFGSQGTGNGQFSGSGPEGIAIDAFGNIWVSDTYGGRVQKFTSAGVFIKVVGSKGSNPGQLGEPTGIDVDPSGRVWVADWQNHRITVFNSNGEYVAQYGSAGSGDGQFNNPDEIEIDKLGNVWVGDQSNHRVQQLDLSGQFKAKFGSNGAGPGQFSFSYPFGIATDSKGRIWIADVNNNRIQEWLLPVEKPTFLSSFGTNGSADGQLKYPGDVTVGLDGNLWVVDKSNNRIQKFDPSGKFLSKFGAAGTGNGQFNRPAAIAVDRDGNLLVADANNNRIQKFDPSGNFLMKFGTAGTGNGQFSAVEGVVADIEGNIWVADTYNGRIQKFDEGGKFLEVVGSKGSNPGQLGEPTGIDVDPSTGNIWVADWQNHRIAVFDEDGDFVSHFGSQGAGPGQFSNPDEIEIDSKGNVWVGDQSNNRVQRFDLNGQFVGQFGSPGSGEGQFSFSYPMGISADRLGHIWIADVNNNRVQHWQLGSYATPPAPSIDLSDGDPKVEVKNEAGLVTSVTGNAAGAHTYAHIGDFTSSHNGPEGEVVYEKDTAGRLSKVTLPNGTWASIAYFADNRVKTVTLKQASWAFSKTTTFEYQDGPPQRRTVVDPPDAPVVTYEIASDGSVLKWWNSAQPPTIDFTAGTLWDHREKDDDLWAGDHLLDVQAFSPEGIASIWVVTNGDELVHETTCDQTEASGTECVSPPLVSEWVMNTGQYPPGHLPIEVIVTDHAEGTATRRFWVDIPEPPPPPAPGTPVPPKFAEILNFRNEYGLEKVFPVANEIERNERIFNLINAWYQGDPVARTSRERWGVPLRPEDIAELEYREWLYDVNGEKIDQWVEATSPNSYAGYYMDHAAGGIMHIGFLGNQAEQLASLEASLSLVGGSSRLQVYPTPPTASYLSVRATTESVMDAIDANSTLADLVISVEDDEAGRATRVGTSNVAQVEGILDQMVGANAPVAVEYEAGGGAFLAGRYRNEGRMRAGDYINSDFYLFEGIPTGLPCTAGFGAKHIVDKPGTEEDVHRLFVLTAGHCAVKGDQEVWRNTYDGDHQFEFSSAGKSEVGRVARSAFQWADGPGRVRTDGTAIRITQGGIVPRAIWGWDGHALPTEPAGRARKGNVVCYSGAISKNVSCGKIVARSLRYRVTGAYAPFGLAGYWVRFPEDRRPEKGDSGSPVWNKRTGASIGLVSFGRPLGSFDETLVAPLLHPPHMPPKRVPGILHHHGMDPLQLKLGG